MKKKLAVILCLTLFTCAAVIGCGQNSETVENKDSNTAEAAHEKAANEPEQAMLEDGVYLAEFDTDSSMFHVSEACDGKGTLTVENGQMIIHVSLASQNIVNLYPGLAEDAQKEGAEILEPTVDSVTYSDESRKRSMALIFRYLHWMKSSMWLWWEQRAPGMIIR